MIALRRFGKARDDSGVTMAELLVTVVVATVVLTMVGSLFANVARTTATANDSRSSTATAANIANELADVIRPAVTNPLGAPNPADPAIIEGNASLLTIYTYADSSASDVRPIRVRFALNAANQLVESRWNGTFNSTNNVWSFPALTAAPSSSRTFPGVIVGPIAGAAAGTTDAAPLFSFVDSSSTVLVVPTTGLTDIQRATVGAVRFTVRTRTERSSTAKVAVIQNLVGMPNVDLQGKDDR